MDLAIVEECGAGDECAVYTEVYGADVLQIEYPDSLAEAGTDFREVCTLPECAERTILRDRALVGPAEPGHVFEAC